MGKCIYPLFLAFFLGNTLMPHSPVVAENDSQMGCSSTLKEYTARGTALLINRFIEAILEQQNKASPLNRSVLHRVSRSVNSCEVNFRSEQCHFGSLPAQSEYLFVVDQISDSLVEQGVIEKTDAASARILLSCALLRESSKSV